MLRCVFVPQKLVIDWLIWWVSKWKIIFWFYWSWNFNFAKPHDLKYFKNSFVSGSSPEFVRDLNDCFSILGKFNSLTSIFLCVSRNLRSRHNSLHQPSRRSLKWSNMLRQTLQSPRPLQLSSRTPLALRPHLQVVLSYRTRRKISSRPPYDHVFNNFAFCS